MVLFLDLPSGGCRLVDELRVSGVDLVVGFDRQTHRGSGEFLLFTNRCDVLGEVLEGTPECFFLRSVDKRAML